MKELLVPVIFGLVFVGYAIYADAQIGYFKTIGNDKPVACSMGGFPRALQLDMKEAGDCTGNVSHG